MNIAFSNGTMTLTKSNGDIVVINLEDVTAVKAIRRPVQVRNAVGTGPSVAQVYDPTTNSWSGQQVTTTYDYFVRLNMADGQFQDLAMGEQSGAGAGWANSQTGANTAVGDIENAIPNT